MTLPVNAVNFVEGMNFPQSYQYDTLYNVSSTGSFSCFVKLIILCVVGKYLAVSVPFLAAVLFFIQVYYLRTSRQVRLLDIEAKAPLYTHFLETIRGISTIRAYNWESPFLEESQSILNHSQKPFYMLFCTQQWLALVLDLVVGAIAVILVGITASSKDSFSGASIGVALNLILTFNQSLTQAIKSWTMLETSIGAVSRVQSFVQNTPSENNRQSSSQSVPGHDWPS